MGFGSRSAVGTNAVVILGFALLAASPAAAQLDQTATTSGLTASPTGSQTTFTHIVEWDIPSGGDLEPGAVALDTQGKDKNRVWFLTRNGAQKVYRFDPAKSLMTGSAQWSSWDLSQTTPVDSTGGLKRLKPSDDRRYVFVRTNQTIQRVDTQNCKPATVKTSSSPALPPSCELTVWQDQLGNTNVSDLAVDNTNRVFTTATPVSLDTTAAYVQMLTPGLAPPAGPSVVKVKRWKVGGGAGFCPQAGISAPCLSGIDVFSAKYKNLVYYSEPVGNNIGELNVATNAVRRWSLDKVNASEPRQLSIDRYGKVWVVTGSGHVVSLDPSSNRMTSHRVPVEVLAGSTTGESDLFGVAPDDDVIGYTNAALSENKVAMVFPKGNAVYVTPICDTIYPMTADVPVLAETSVFDSNSVKPQGKIAPVTITKKTDGTFVEARVDQAQCESSFCMNDAPSLSPRGITPNRSKSQGTFFYTVAFSDAVRIGFARRPHREKLKNGRDDDDCDDGEDAMMHPGWHDHSRVDDADDDGVDSKYDSKVSREDSQTGDATVLSAGQVAEYPVAASSTTLALIANVTAVDPLAQLGVEIYNALGALVASGTSVGGIAVATVSAPAAGAYNVRVKNYGAASVTQTPTLLVREPWVP